MAGGADWDPMRELLGVQKRMNQLFETALARTDIETPGGVDTWSPLADVYATPEAVVLCLELPGLALEQIDLRIDGDELIVEGERRMEREQPGERFHRVERAYGKFARRFRLPSTADRQSVDASYRDGVLRVVLPNLTEKRSRPIKVSIH